MPFPTTRDEMVKQKYEFSNHGVCRSCREEIEWWTTPKGGKMPFNLMQTGESEPVTHFRTCPNADEHRRKQR